MKTNEPFFSPIDPDITQRLTTRRTALTGLMKLGGVSLTAPLVLASLSQEAFGRSSMPDGVFAVLRLALMLERLEHDFYEQALRSPGLIPAAHHEIIQTLERHEAEHSVLLATATGRAIDRDEFDFTARGRYPDVFRNYRTFLEVAQALEDNGVRAYKGQAPNLMSVGPILSIALRIHSVEGRHATMISRLRGQRGWVTGTSPGGRRPPGTEGVYGGEGLTTQMGVPLAGTSGTPATAASEAFDEPITRAQVLRNAAPFVVRSPLYDS